MSGNEDIRKNIIEATRKLIAKKTSITIRDIADACFVNVAAVNYYFGSKDRLLAIVLEEMIEEIKISIVETLNAFPKSHPVENILESMINLIYSYAIGNLGVIGYLFMNVENRELASKLFVDAFFKEGDFKQMVFHMMKEASDIQDESSLYARYIMLFSCFCIPLVIQILSDPESGSGLEVLTSEKFKQQYIEELMKMIR
ncbi:MAG: TetR/AcrR family transcriptional regulator [Acholeplasmataceae bacterium]|nr:TetR/AcrR family transcriptional regulator [Acholeplasmataceae bacterium]